jgi:hypothetical protein
MIIDQDFNGEIILWVQNGTNMVSNVMRISFVGEKFDSSINLIDNVFLTLHDSCCGDGKVVDDDVELL